MCRLKREEMGKREETGGPGRSGPRHVYYGTVAWIAVLLGCWFVISQWPMLPTLISTTMAALP